MVSADVHRVSSVSELAELVRQAARDGRAIYPRSGGTMLNFGMPATKPGIAVDLTGLAQVIDYPARDMTITVQAGITIAKLQETLAKENQQLPIDVPLPERATLGGAIACNVSGPRRYGYGTFRDYVLGISVVNDRGEEVKAGGRVVKNVAGYDLCKLHIGALGTLGIITQVTLKVLPRPEAVALVRTSCPPEVLSDLLNRLHATATRPVCLDLHDEPRNSPDVSLFIGFEGNRAAVDWQVEKLREEVSAAAPSFIVHRDGLVEREMRVLAETSVWSAYRLTFRANLLPSAVSRFVLAARESPDMAVLHAQAGNGIVTGHFRDPTDKDDATRLISKLRAEAMAVQGNLILICCPDEWKAGLGVWGDWATSRGDWELMRRVKRQLDPQNVFNPGRFAGGI
jgi:glycolate dehydrogenase FAD-binding subunit